MMKWQPTWALRRSIDWWRVGAVGVVVLIAWALAAWLTPYRESARTEFGPAPQAVTYVRAEVTEINGSSGQARLIDGARRGQTVPLQFYNNPPHLGSTVLVSSDAMPGSQNVSEPWRLPAMVMLLAVMIIMVIAIGGRQGALSLVGLGVSIAIVAWYIIPRILAGDNALLASTIGAFAIATVAVVIAHRLRWRTLISLVCIYLVLGFVVGLTVLSGWLANLSGIYDETSSLLVGGVTANLDMYGILLGGIIIASLGVLDDVVTTQVAAVDELRQVKPHASYKELFGRGMSVGREHLSALINTLALAYVGVALPSLLILIVGQPAGAQLLLTLNYEYVAVEVIRTIIASLGIIVAIPASTLLAVVLIGQKQRFIAILKSVQPNARR